MVIVVEVGNIGKGIKFVHVGMADIAVVVCVLVALVTTIGIVVVEVKVGLREWSWW